MAKVTGIGGIFFKSNDTETTNKWYADNLGLPTSPYGTTFNWHPLGQPNKQAVNLWTPFKADTKYFEPSEKDFMINFRVDNLEELVQQLKASGIEPLDEITVYDYGKFVHLMDPEGNKIELWEAVDEDYQKPADEA